MAAFLKFVSWVARYGQRAVTVAWRYIDAVIDWINRLQVFEWVWDHLKKYV